MSREGTNEGSQAPAAPALFPSGGDGGEQGGAPCGSQSWQLGEHHTRYRSWAPQGGHLHPLVLAQGIYKQDQRFLHKDDGLGTSAGVTPTHKHTKTTNCIANWVSAEDRFG